MYRERGIKHWVGYKGRQERLSSHRPGKLRESLVYETRAALPSQRRGRRVPLRVSPSHPRLHREVRDHILDNQGQPGPARIDPEAISAVVALMQKLPNLKISLPAIIEERLWGIPGTNPCGLLAVWDNSVEKPGVQILDRNPLTSIRWHHNKMVGNTVFVIPCSQTKIVGTISPSVILRVVHCSSLLVGCGNNNLVGMHMAISKHEEGMGPWQSETFPTGN
ncbi:hypothetical protein R3P38DRAFT_2786758 [Favolaschia claudopus]|uniref:Uncharacterized protein n=1 Tax=Favolaschia claudopus TaxID=2862362 RepID=A0AAW0APD3_9AGAR